MPQEMFCCFKNLSKFSDLDSQFLIARLLYVSLHFNKIYNYTPTIDMKIDKVVILFVNTCSKKNVFNLDQFFFTPKTHKYFCITLGNAIRPCKEVLIPL